MAYEKTLWEAREGDDLDKFNKLNETQNSVTLRNAPTNITKAGTKFSVQKMNKIEDGIYQAHELILQEAIARGASFDELLQLIKLIAPNNDGLVPHNRIQYRVGKVLVQRPNEESPTEAGLPGQWQWCNDLAFQYRLSQTAPGPYTVYAQGANYAAGAMVMYHLAGNDWAFYTAKEALTNVPARLNPVKWTKLTGGTLVFQRFLHAYTAPDFAIGSQVPDGQYAGYYVTEINVYGGKFEGAADGSGGNRGTFGNVHDDRQRSLTGVLDGVFFNYTGIFIPEESIHTVSVPSNDTAPYGSRVQVRFRNEFQTLIGYDNAPSTYAVNYWRLINLQ